MTTDPDAPGAPHAASAPGSGSADTGPSDNALPDKEPANKRGWSAITHALDDADLIGGPQWVRSGVDVVRLAIYAVLLGICGWFTGQYTGTAHQLDQDVWSIPALLPDWVRLIVLGAAQLATVLVVVLLVAGLWRHRKVLAAIALAFALAAGARVLLDGSIHSPADIHAHRVSDLGGLSIVGFPPAWIVAGVVAATVVLGPATDREWHRLVFAVVAVVAIERVVSAQQSMLDVAVTLLIGAVAGSVILVLLGSPRRTTSRKALLDGLAASGFVVTDVRVAERESLHAMTFHALTTDGRELFVKLLSRDDRDADLLLRVYRRLRVKNMDDERAGWDEGRLVDHEALVGFEAAAAGVSVAPVLASGRTPGGDGLLVFEWLTETPLYELSAEQLTPAVLTATFQQVGRLHAAGIAHRWCTPRHALVADSGAVRLTDFRWAVERAAPVQRSADVAALIVGFAAQTAAAQVVAAAAAGLGDQAITDALPLVQPLAMPPDARDAAKRDKELLADVRKQMQQATGDQPYKLAAINRISLTRVVTVVGGILGVYALLGFAANWGQAKSAIAAMPASVIPVLVVLAALPYVTGAATFVSVVPRAIPFRQAIEVMMGQGFLNRFTPASSGGIALQVRYLQTQGVPAAAAATGIALRSVAKTVTKVVVFAIVAAWSGSSGGVHLSLPSASTVAVIVLVVAVAAGVVWLTPWGRRVIAGRLATSVHQMWSTLRELMTQPARLITLLGATFLGDVVTIAAFVVACRGIGIHLGVPVLTLLYLTGSTVASVSPTPGGVGAVEAALVAALTGAGAAAGPATAAVLVFRIATYWLPVPFCWFGLHAVDKLTDASQPWPPSARVGQVARRMRRAGSET